MVIALSATLKILKLIKSNCSISITYLRCKRSIKLPIIPPKTKAKPVSKRPFLYLGLKR